MVAGGRGHLGMMALSRVTLESAGLSCVVLWRPYQLPLSKTARYTDVILYHTLAFRVLNW